MPNGTVKWFDSKKGFGFILNHDGRDVFVHFSSIDGDGFRSLKDGEKVEYEEIEGNKGLSAKNVRRMNVDVQAPPKSSASMGATSSASAGASTGASPGPSSGAR